MALKVALKVPPALLSASCAGRGLFGLLSNLLSVADQLPSAQPDFARFAFHCRSAAVEVGVRALQGGSLTAAEQASAESFLGDALMPRVEADCSALQIRKSDEKSELQRLQTFALSLFTGAEKEHVLGAANKDTMLQYKQSAALLECVLERDSLAEPRVAHPNVAAVAHEAKLRSHAILTCLKAGQVPPPPAGQTADAGLDAELNALGGGDGGGRVAPLAAAASPAAASFLVVPTSGVGAGSSASGAFALPSAPLTAFPAFPAASAEAGGSESKGSESKIGGHRALPAGAPHAASATAKATSAGVPPLPSFPASSSSSSASAPSYSGAAAAPRGGGHALDFGGLGGGGPGGSAVRAPAASASSFLGDVVLSDAGEYCKFVVTALRNEHDAQAALHFAARALNELRPGTFAGPPAAPQGGGVSAEAVLHAVQAAAALAGGAKASRHPDVACAELVATINALRPGTLM